MRKEDIVTITKVKHLPSTLVGKRGEVVGLYGAGNTRTVSVLVEGRTYNLPVANVAPAQTKEA